jgi:DNA-binding MarR family transcriptional regulator
MTTLPHELTPLEQRVLRALANRQASRFAPLEDLVLELDEDRGSLRSALAGLARRDLVTRMADGLRVRSYAITTLGEGAVRDLDAHAAWRERQR